MRRRAAAFPVADLRLRRRGFRSAGLWGGPPGGRGPGPDQVRRPASQGTASKGRAGARQPRAEAGPDSAGRAGGASFRAHFRPRQVTVLCPPSSPMGGCRKLMKMSWVTLDRICTEKMHSDEKIRRQIEGSNRPLRSSAERLSDEELLDKLRGFGFDVDRRSLEQLCEGALSAEEVAGPLMDGCVFRDDSERMQGDWIWICLVSLWQRWWPDRVRPGRSRSSPLAFAWSPSGRGGGRTECALSFWTTRSRPATARSGTTQAPAPLPGLMPGPMYCASATPRASVPSRSSTTGSR